MLKDKGLISRRIEGEDLEGWRMKMLKDDEDLEGERLRCLPFTGLLLAWCLTCPLGKNLLLLLYGFALVFVPAAS